MGNSVTESDAACSHEHAVVLKTHRFLSRKEPDGCYTDATRPIGSRPANALGLYDTHRNVGEWTANWYATDAIEALCANGQLGGPAEGRQRVARRGHGTRTAPIRAVRFAT